MTPDYIIISLKEPLKKMPPSFYWDSSITHKNNLTTDQINEGCNVIRTHCENLRMSLGHLPNDVEEILVFKFKELGFNVLNVCQEASKYATQCWLNRTALDKEKEIEDDYVYVRNRAMERLGVR